jgi:BolA family transcriptional regulator, general stress-responsive regulator
MGGGGDRDKALQRRFRSRQMTVSERIRGKLTEAFHPVALNVVDESHLHKGHAGHRPEGESHFRIKIIAAAFRGRSRVEAHRMVYAALAQELADGVHALAIEATPPSANN